VGGIAEMFCRDEQIILSKRKGFIKLALETGADIIPHYTFGANETYYRPFGPSSVLAKISSKLRVSIVPWFGRWWIPLGAVPFRVPVLDVMGPVMEVPKHKPVTEWLVSQVHAKFCHELRKLFDEYKVVYVKEMGASDAWLTKKLRFEDE
jgi:hypothetical protein